MPLYRSPEPGTPPGGSTAQVLAKASGADFDTEWADQSGGGGRFPWTTVLGPGSDKAYRVPGMIQGGGSSSPSADRIALFVGPIPWEVKVRAISVWLTSSASGTTLYELALYDGATLERVTTFGTIDLSASTGFKRLVLGTPVVIPHYAVWAGKLLNASSNGGALRDSDYQTGMHCIGNYWDGPGGNERSLGVGDAGTGAMPSTLSLSGLSEASRFPAFSIELEAI